MLKFASMIARNIHKDVIDALQHFPIVGILGSRQVGKTTLAKEIQKDFELSIYIDLELPSDYDKLENAEFFLASMQDRLVIIDEIQRRPELFPLLRALVDQNRRPARFIILGSSSPDLIRKASDSLAGRIRYFELTPFLYSEIKSEAPSFRVNWLRGGYAESFLAATDEISFGWRIDFIKTFLERDVPNFGLKIPAVQLRRFWTMLAHTHGSLWNASKIASALGVTSPTTKYYLDILEHTFIVRRLAPFFTNQKKRLVKSQKFFLRDSGLLHCLLNITTEEELLGNPIAGYSWEGYVIEQIMNILPRNYFAYFYRTAAGAEIDLVITKADKPVWGCEIKFTLSPVLGKSFWSAFEDLRCEKAFVIYPGKDAYKMSEKVHVIPFTQLEAIF